MKINKPGKLILTGIVGCGICCLPLLLPVGVGLAGLSILGFSFNSLWCGLIALFLSIALVGFWLVTKRKTTDN